MWGIIVIFYNWDGNNRKGEQKGWDNERRLRFSAGVNVQSQQRDHTSYWFHPFKITSCLPNECVRVLVCECASVCVRTCAYVCNSRLSLLNFALGSFLSALFPPFILIYLSEVVFRDVACHSSAQPIKHTVMTDWPRSKLITDWLTERVALFCSAVFDSCLPDISGSGNFKCSGVFPHATPLSLTLKVTWIWISTSLSSVLILMMKSKIYSEGL